MNERAPRRIHPALLFCGLFAGLLLAYGPALTGTLLWDDAGHVTAPALRSLSGLGRIWTQVGATQQYYPLLHSAFWVEHRLWGDATLGYHLANLAQHALNAVLVYLIVRRLALPGALFAAALFAFHPVCVESVAWISEQKNTLSAVFYLLAALVYLDFDAGRRPRAYAGATALFLAAILTKSVTVSLPAALLVVFWWRRGALSLRRDVVPLVPWFVVGVAMSVVTSAVEHHLIGATGREFGLAPLQRLLLAAHALWFYAAKVVWPHPLIFIYPRWDLSTVSPGLLATFVATLAGFAVFLWLALARGRRSPLAAALYFAGTLTPALGFIDLYPFRYSYVADHFQYLACLGILVPLASVLTSAGRWLPAGTGRAARSAAGAALVALLAGLARAQSAQYQGLFSLWRTTLDRNPRCWLAEGNLASALVDAGRAAEAVPHFERALALNPEGTEAENSLGDALNRLGRPAEALPHLRHAVAAEPGFAEAHNNLGVSLMMSGEPAQGLAEFQRAVAERPNFAQARLNLGLALASQGRAAEALPQFEAAAAADPGSAAAQLDWAIALTVLARPRDALPHYAEALRLDPASGEAHLKLALTLHELGRDAEAQTQLAAARALGATVPNFP